MNAAVAKTSEPTMEEILASIRKIIAEDTTPLPAPLAAAEGRVQSAPPPKPRLVDPPVIEARPVEAAPPPNPAPPVSSQPVILPAEPAPSPEVLPDIRAALAPDPIAGAPSEAVDAPEPLMSSATDEAVTQSFGALAHAHLAQQLPPLEDIVREMLRPMLKNWLDDNLPTIVEKLVRAEIERVARGGRG